MLIHLRLAQLVLDLPDCEPLFALEIVNFTKPFNCLRAIEETVSSRSLAHGLENTLLYVETDLGWKDACPFGQLASFDEHLATPG